jgi:hypothetical protein
MSFTDISAAPVGIRYGQRRTNAAHYARRGFRLCTDQHCDEPLPAYARSRLVHAVVLVIKCSRSQKNRQPVLRAFALYLLLCVYMLYNHPLVVPSKVDAERRVQGYISRLKVQGEYIRDNRIWRTRRWGENIPTARPLISIQDSQTTRRALTQRHR